MTQPVDLLWDSLTTSVKESQARKKTKETAGALNSIRVIDQLIAGLPEQRRVLRNAKETLEPAAIRIAAASLERTRALLLLAHDMLQPTDDLTEGQKEAYGDAQARAVTAFIPLEEEVERARGQAHQLDASVGGALSPLHRTAPSTSPQETRDRAHKAAPMGLCDDVTMQSVDSHACPLNVPQRDAVRDLVIEGLEVIAKNWASAALLEHVKTRLKPLLQKGGLHPLVGILISIATGWIASRIGAMAVGALAGAPVPTPSMPNAGMTVLLPALPARTVDLTSPIRTVLNGLATKLAESASGGEQPNRDSVQALYSSIAGAAASWGATAKAEVRQLPDPALVSLAEGLKASAFTMELFAAKIERLLERFDVVEEIGVVTIDESQPLQPVVVVVPGGDRRLALVRAATELVENSKRAPGKDADLNEYERRTGQFRFHSWVDRSLKEIAVAKETPNTMLMYNDSRWVVAPVDPTHFDDVEMLASEPRKESKS